MGICSENWSPVRMMSHARSLIKLSLLLLIVESVSSEWKPNNREKEVLCKTSECKTRGDQYKNNMDTRVNPCQDFYTFTCGNWHKNHPGPKYTPGRSVLDVMNFEFSQIIRKILESYKFPSEGGNILFRRAKEIYEICVKIPEYTKKEASDIAREVKKIGRVPKTPLWDMHYKYLKLSGESAFFRTTILGETSDGMPVLIVMEPASAYGSIFHEETWKPQEKQAYIDFLFLIMKSLKTKESDELIKESIEEVFEFRKKLDRIIEQNTEEDPDSLNPLTGPQLDIWFSDILRHQTYTQDITWTKVIDALFHKLPSHTWQTQKLIAMRRKEYFLDLMDLLRNVPEEVLAIHMEIYFVERHLKLKENMFKLLEATSIEPHNLLRYIREKYRPRWETCIENHNMKETLERMLFEKWFRREQRETVHHLIIRLQTAIYNQIRNSKWLDQPTRVDIIGKLNELEEWIGFPPWINGFGAPRGRDKDEILKPNASFNIKQNRLYIHAALLLPPIFSPTIPAVYNYAGIGTTIGHELYHVIDDCGSYLDDNANIVWWSPEMRTKCLGLKLLFVEVYNNITNWEFKNRYNMDVKSNTTHTFLEDFPDVMGLSAAFNAYKELASNEKSVCKTLPHFEKYSCDQMFYVAFANTYCGYLTEKSAAEKLQVWNHSIESVRVNGAVAQMQSFGTAFECTIGSPMNPQEKLNLWK